MKNINEVICKYTAGGASLDETNAALTEAGCGFLLVPERNTLTEAELRATTVGAYPDMANGWGLLDTGTGSLDKVEVRNGKLVDGGIGKMPGYVIIAGRAYKVQDDALAEK